VKIGDIIRFNEKAGNHHVDGKLESMNGKVFLILDRYFMTDAGGHAYNGIHLPNWDLGGEIPVIPYPWKYNYAKGEMGVWDEWQSSDCFMLVGHVNLSIVVQSRG
jgi:hypothetical protein